MRRAGSQAPANQKAAGNRKTRQTTHPRVRPQSIRGRARFFCATESAGTAALNALAKLDRARLMLAEARTLSELKNIRDKAEAVKAYARAQKIGIEVQNSAGEIVAEATRRMGEFLLTAEKNPGARRYPKGTAKQAPLPTLKEMGISKKQSAICQDIARLPQEKFREHINAIKNSGQVITIGALAMAAKEYKKTSRPVVLTVQHFQPAEADSPEAVLADQFSDRLKCIQGSKSNISVNVTIANGLTSIAFDYLNDSEVKMLLEIL